MSDEPLTEEEQAALQRRLGAAMREAWPEGTTAELALPVYLGAAVALAEALRPAGAPLTRAQWIAWCEATWDELAQFHRNAGQA